MSILKRNRSFQPSVMRSTASVTAVRSSSLRQIGTTTTWTGARRGGTTRPSSSECAMIKAPIKRVEEPHEVVQAYASWLSGVVYLMSNVRAKFCPRLWLVPAWSARPSCIIASMA